MHKKTLFEFHEAATNRAANDFVYGDHEQGVIPQDLLLDLLEKYNWPIELRRVLRSLEKDHFVHRSGDIYELAPKGLSKS